MTDGYPDVFLVNYYLWTTYIGLDIVNPSKHSSLTLFDLCAKSISRYINPDPAESLDIYIRAYSYWPEIEFNYRFLLLLSSTFRTAVKSQEVKWEYRSGGQGCWSSCNKFHWKIPYEYTLVRKLLLAQVLSGEHGQTCTELQPHILEFFEWLDIPVMCKTIRVGY